MLKTSPDSTSSVSRQPLSLHQSNLEVFLPKEDNQKTCGLGHSEHTSSVDVLPSGKVVFKTLCNFS